MHALGLHLVITSKWCCLEYSIAVIPFPLELEFQDDEVSGSALLVWQFWRIYKQPDFDLHNPGNIPFLPRDAKESCRADKDPNIRQQNRKRNVRMRPPSIKPVSVDFCQSPDPLVSG
ncbi:MAG: hypothetical protein M2R45_05323 [Verrucomicrobia subdivision 3 bacterium]|nr:hypothetical protein [Limisphaerales bacterium]MCS1415719.1 hypothetical protein [Limisphaerales bacterium]